MAELLVARDITKRFGGVQALSDVSLTVEQGSVHSLVGENGAGKSTFGRILAGFFPPDGGSLSIDGSEVRFRSTRDALLHGITIVGQERTVIPQQTVVENIFLGREPRSRGFLNTREVQRRYDALCQRTGFSLPAHAKVGNLRISEQLHVEIMRALVRDARLIVMDEVTAALSAAESERVFAVVRALREEGRAVLYISHFLKEVLALSDFVTVFRDGRLIRTAPAREETSASLVAAMVGRTLELSFPAKAYPAPEAPVVLSVEGLHRPGIVRDVSFEIRAGEIVGLAGLIGSGRTEAARAVFGADRKSGGVVRIDGNRVDIKSPRDAIDAGIALLPESRKEQGLLMRRSIIENISLAHLSDVRGYGVLRFRKEREAAESLISQLDVRTSSARALVETLSGGNQQKVLFAKWLFRSPRVLIADEPTRGVDVGAKHAIYALIAELAERGMAVLLISSELEEVLGLSHRVLVMRQGALVAEFAGEDATDDAVMRAAFAA